MEKNKREYINNFKIFNFNESYVAPTNTINARDNFINWGSDNQYPTYLLNLYNNYGYALHKSIINKKVRLTTGNGINDVISSELASFIKKNKLDKELVKANADLEIFNWFAFEIIYNNDGTLSSVKHMPAYKLRLGIKTEEINYNHFLFCNDWTKYKKKEYAPEVIREFNPLIKQGKQIFAHFEYCPGVEYYSFPIYSESINYIELGYEISKFHLNQAKNGYAPQFLLNFATGIPSIEEQDEFYSQFKREFKGTQGNNVIITYSEGQDGKPEFIPIQLNNSDERFLQLNDQVQEVIVMSAEIPAQMVILTPGKLGSTEDRASLLDEFQKSYITPRQNTIENVINEILSQDFSEEITLKQYNQQ
jgi:hypothetical protein